MCCAMHSVCIVEMMLVCSMFVRSYMCTQMTARLRQYMYARVVTRQRQGMPRSCELYLMRPESSSDRFFLPCLNLNLPRCGMSNSLGTNVICQPTSKYFSLHSLHNDWVQTCIQSSSVRFGFRRRSMTPASFGRMFCHCWDFNMDFFIKMLFN